MARNLGGWLEDPAVFGESLKGVRFYDGEGNRAYFGTPDRPGQIYKTMQRIIDVWSSLGRLKGAHDTRRLSLMHLGGALITFGPNSTAEDRP